VPRRNREVGSGVVKVNVPSPLPKVPSGLRYSHIAVSYILVNPCAPAKAPVPPVVVISPVTPNSGSPTGPGGPIGTPCATYVPKILSAGFARSVRINVPVMGYGGTGSRYSADSKCNSLSAKRLVAPVASMGVLTTKQTPGTIGAPTGSLQVAVNA